MPVYEISNPSDCYTISGDLKTCCVAVVYLGRGRMGLKDETGKTVFPIFMLGGMTDLDDFFRESFRESFKDADQSIPFETLAQAFDSVLIGNFQDRGLITDLLALIPEDKREEKRIEIHDQRRTSMTDIGRACWDYAAQLRKVNNNVPG